MHASLATGNTIITGSIRTGSEVIAADMRIDSLSETIGRIKPGPYGFLAILDRNGRYLYHPDLGYVLTKRVDFRYNELFGGRGIEGIARYDDVFDGRKVLVTASVVESTGWTVLVYYDYEGGARPTLAYLETSLAALALLVIGSVLIMYRGARRVSRVLGSFVERTNLIANGRYSAAVGAVEYAEFQPLADNFDAMARSVTGHEEALRRLNAALESKVEERTGELAKANAELRAANGELGEALRALRDAQAKIVTSEKMTALGRIAAGIAHELNTPLAVMESSLQTIIGSLDRDLSGNLDLLASLGTDARRLVREASRAVIGADFGSIFPDPAEQRRERSRIAEILSREGCGNAFSCADALVALGIPSLAGRAAPLLAGARGEELLALLRDFIAPIHAAKIASMALGQASQFTTALRTYFLGGSSEAPTEIRLAPQLAAVLSLFRNRLRGRAEVALEVGEDARAWGKPEEVGRIWFNLLSNAVQAVAGGGSILVRAEAAGELVEVHVMDSGPGIPDEVKPNIFSPFFTTRPLGEGSGLGLDVALRLARANGGDIRFESEPGRTDFTVSLRAGPPRT